MSLLIDGYNLLHASGVLAPEGRGTSLERARGALLDCLQRLIDPGEQSRTTVVFDGRDAPPGLPGRWRHGELEVRFAARHREADELLEELIEADNAPRQLTVVSSDHRVQRAARRRDARAVDSDVWFREQSRQRPLSVGDGKPRGPLSDDEVERWLREFGRDA
ncbi:MAG: NYN domain-containing protein [Pirellulaceae bacterium]|nr:NYN domain-containing protein [Pirellulaceae bacterium]